VSLSKRTSRCFLSLDQGSGWGTNQSRRRVLLNENPFWPTIPVKFPKNRYVERGICRRNPTHNTYVINSESHRRTSRRVAMTRYLLVVTSFILCRPLVAVQVLNFCALSSSYCLRFHSRQDTVRDTFILRVKS
jgi:hypothetical protein